jgi:hypothetical protein
VVAAETTVAPKLRVSLARIAESSHETTDESLLPCLSELDAERAE